MLLSLRCLEGFLLISQFEGIISIWALGGGILKKDFQMELQVGLFKLWIQLKFNEGSDSGNEFAKNVKNKICQIFEKFKFNS